MVQGMFWNKHHSFDVQNKLLDMMGISKHNQIHAYNIPPHKMYTLRMRYK